MTYNKAFMQKALKHVNELKQETIEKSKKVPNSEKIVEVRMKEFHQTGFVTKDN